MSWLLESPLPALLGGGMLTVLLISGWVQTARTWPLFVAAGVLLVTISLVILERAVETDREQVTRTLEQIVQVVEDNNLQGLLDQIHPRKEDILARARREFPNYKFGKISIRPNLEVTTRDGEPAKAHATFNVVADGSITNMRMEQGTVRRWVEVDFEQHQGKWLVVGYDHFEPFHGMRDTYSDRY